MADLKTQALQLLLTYWWPVTVVIAASSLGLIRQYWPRLWAWIPYRFQWAPAALLSMLSAAIDYAATGASPADTWKYVVATFLATIGVVHTVPRVTGAPAGTVERHSLLYGLLKTCGLTNLKQTSAPPPPSPTKPTNDDCPPTTPSAA